ncbi:MAG TPA: hypothetical protein VLM18_06140 [Croceibacterium sp.]|nr:hypothetical protein [Croceibacterium sp.]
MGVGPRPSGADRQAEATRPVHPWNAEHVDYCRGRRAARPSLCPDRQQRERLLEHRPQPTGNAFNSSIGALDATTGKPVWHFQTVHKDVWDYDIGSQPTLVDLLDGTPAIVVPSKQGDIYVLDRRTGKPLHDV